MRLTLRMRDCLLRLEQFGVLVAFIWACSCRGSTHVAGGPDGKQEAPDACSSPFFFTAAQSCGGTVQGSGSTPSGAFSAASIQADLGSTGSPYRLTLTITDANGQATLILRFPRLQDDGGAEIFVGSHQADAILESAPTCSMVNATGEVQITSADDPSTAFSTQTGTVTGTFSLTTGGYSLSGSFQTPYCRFTSPNG